jgi:enoyl-CoA hydratase / 3-hydroxyacyl-CoA dehydrogenase
MAYINHITVSKLSVIGAGQIGPDILLHFSKIFADHHVNLVLVDISETALQNAQKKIEKKIDKGIETGAFKPGQGEAMKKSIRYTNDYSEIKGSEIVLEAATESETIKDSIFLQAEAICDEKTIFLSNSSHMQPEVIFRNIKNKTRCLVAHYFFPADRNPVVELVPSSETATELTANLLSFYESMGKVPMLVKSSYGYAIDPIFEGLCQTAIMCLEKGWGNEKQIDKVAMETLGLGVGPFTALNLTGGNPITAHGLDEMGKKVMPWFNTPTLLKEMAINKTAWNTAAKDETVDIPEMLHNELRNTFLGAYFALACFIIDLDITNVNDLDMACELSLVIKPPFTFMNETGLVNVMQLVKKFCSENPDFKFPRSLETSAKNGKWEIGNVVKTVKDNVAILTIRKPKVLNALDSMIMSELLDHFSDIETDGNLIGSVLTGFGNKAFVSGADIRELASCETPEEGYANSRHFHAVMNYIQEMKKPVICAYNGFAFGGGNELGMACTLRIAKKGLTIAFCQPEVNLGFIPGAGGTQRLPRIIGIKKASEILRTGKPVSEKEALESGFIYKEADDLIAEGVFLVHQIAEGKIKPPHIKTGPILTGNQTPDEVNLGSLSKKIDDILCRAIYEGAGMSLEDGLELESRLFGECIKTQDMKIGINTFMTKGAKAKADFVNQ